VSPAGATEARWRALATMDAVLDTLRGLRFPILDLADLANRITAERAWLLSEIASGDSELRRPPAPRHLIRPEARGRSLEWLLPRTGRR